MKKTRTVRAAAAWTAAFLAAMAAGCRSERAGAAEPPRTPKTAAEVEAILSKAPFRELLTSDAADVPVRREEVPAVRKLLWEKYKGEQLTDGRRVEEHRTKQLRFGGAVMRYEYRKVGDKPASGYPLYIALHGGGGAPAEVNDMGWNHMKIYYLASVKAGIYVAPRGVSDTWNLHSQGQSFPLYDRLIENMILFEDADPGRVYLLGYSAGGDGVYQTAPRMADRFAAANMSAGHHNGASPVNLCNLPFLLQVGELDTAYGRHRATVEYAAWIARACKENGGPYVHDLFVHAGRGHGFIDNDPHQRPQQVLADPQAWHDGKGSAARAQNTNAIAWLSAYARDPHPARVVWDLGMRADRSGVHPTEDALWMCPNRGKQFYWLDVTGLDPAAKSENPVIARLDKAENAVIVEKTSAWLRLLFSSDMLDLAKPVKLKAAGREWTLTLAPNLRTMAQTLADRGDPAYLFESAITIERRGDETNVK